MKLFLTVFLSMFLAELGDKTQLAAVLFSSENGGSRLLVFLAAAAALVAATGLAIFLGAAAERFLAGLPLKLIAGTGFLLIGAALVGEHFFKAG